MEAADLIALHLVLMNDNMAIRMISTGAGFMELVAIHMSPSVKAPLSPDISYWA